MNAPGQDMDTADKRPMLGMKLLTGLKPASDGATLGGEIYNRENAKTYSVRLTLDGAQQLVVRAYVWLPLFGRTQVWQRATAKTMPKPVTEEAPAAEPVKGGAT